METILFIFFVLGVIIGGITYFLPGIIAGYRKHEHKNAITFLNLIAGWTILGWIALLVWAFVDKENNKDYKIQLLKLYELKEKGTITEEQFNNEKMGILKLLDNNVNYEIKSTDDNDMIGCYCSIGFIMILFILVIIIAKGVLHA